MTKSLKNHMKSSIAMMLKSPMKTTNSPLAVTSSDVRRVVEMSRAPNSAKLSQQVLCAGVQCSLPGSVGRNSLGKVKIKMLYIYICNMQTDMCISLIAICIHTCVNMQLRIYIHMLLFLYVYRCQNIH